LEGFIVARKKKNEEELLLEEEVDLDIEDSFEEDEEEDEESDLLDEEALRKEPEVLEVAASAPAKAPSRKRNTPKKTVEAPAPLKTEEKGLEPQAAASAVSPGPVGPTPLPTVPPTPPVDPALAQWEAAQKTSQSIIASLENVNAILKELPEHYASVIQKTLKQTPSRPSSASRFAFAMSLLAIVLSVLSLSFSQSVRSQVLTQVASTPAPHTARVAKESHSIDSVTASAKEREEALMALVPKAKKKKAK
jgi:hypothetical protein